MPGADVADTTGQLADAGGVDEEFSSGEYRDAYAGVPGVSTARGVRTTGPNTEINLATAITAGSARVPGPYRGNQLSTFPVGGGVQPPPGHPANAARPGGRCAPWRVPPPAGGSAPGIAPSGVNAARMALAGRGLGGVPGGACGRAEGR